MARPAPTFARVPDAEPAAPAATPVDRVEPPSTDVPGLADAQGAEPAPVEVAETREPDRIEAVPVDVSPAPVSEEPESAPADLFEALAPERGDAQPTEVMRAPEPHAGEPAPTETFGLAEPPEYERVEPPRASADTDTHTPQGEPGHAARDRAPDDDVPMATARPITVVPPSRRQRSGRGATGAVPASPGRPRTTGRARRWGVRVLALAALVVIGVALYLINATFQPFHGDGEGAVAVNVPPGANVAAIGELLEERGVVASGEFFNINVTLTGRRGNLQPGDYTLKRNMSYGDASEALMQGPEIEVVKTFNVTIPEGQSIREISGRVRESAVRGNYRTATELSRFRGRARDLGLPRAQSSLEGFMFPATYEMAAGDRARDLVAKQLQAFERNFSTVNMARAQRRNLTRYDVLIIASMVEREAALERERPLIAAVIHNRLREGMPLGIDATIRYATGNWSRPIRVSELQADGPYNTRLRTGLPPTPIGNPGLSSIEAAADPADVDHLYYVVKPGTCGEHAFSSTDAQFQRDVARYNAAREARGGQSPTDC